MKKKILSASVAVCILTASLLGGCSNSDDTTTESVTYVEVLNTSYNTISNSSLYSGTIKPNKEITVIAKAQGFVDKVNFEIGDYVNEGDVLFTIDTTDILNAKAIAEAQLKQVDANVQSAKTSAELVNGAAVKTQIESAKAGYAQAEIGYNTAKTAFENNKILYESGIISKTEYTQIENAYLNAEIAYNQAKASYENMLQMVKDNERQANDGVAIAEASREAVVAQIATYDQSLEDAEVKSPIKGIVTACNVTEGAMLAAQQPFVVVDTTVVKLNVSVSADMINSIREGETVDVSIPDVSRTPKKGKVKTVNPAANMGGTYDVVIEIPNSDSKIKSGMFGEVNFVKEQKDNTIILPVNTVITRNDETYVYVMENDRAVKTNVITGIRTGTEIEIVNGLEENMLVVVKGHTYIEDGDLIAVSNEINADGALTDSE